MLALTTKNMHKLAQNTDLQERKPEAAITAAEQGSAPEQITEKVTVVPISQVLKLTGPDGKQDEIICYGDAEELGEGVTMTKAKIIPMEIAEQSQVPLGMQLTVMMDGGLISLIATS